MNRHASDELLKAYAAGNIDAVSGLMVATHLEICVQCRERVEALEQEMGLGLYQQDGGYTGEFDQMLEDILIQEPVVQVSQLRETVATTVAGKNFSLPESLSRFADRIGEWRRYGNKVMSAQIELGESARVSLLYLAENARVPQHTHKGLESTLVLHGGFSDEDGHYHQGDMLVCDSSDKHTPYTREGEDCLCLVVLTQPMIFTQGVARIFNRFGRGMYP